MLPSFPAFSHVVSAPFKRSQLGLFHGKMKQFGNSVPFSKGKTRRSWLPNIQSKWLFSDAMGKGVQVKLSTKALKTIKKVGGLDSYVLNTRHELLGYEGMRIRLMVRDRLADKS